MSAAVAGRVAGAGEPVRQLAFFPAAPVELLAVLEDALHPKPDGTRHHRKCLNRTMNASETECSPKCVRANDLLARRAAPGRAGREEAAS